MTDEIDVEESRLEYLKAQHEQRIADIIEENEGLYDWAPPKVESDMVIRGKAPLRRK